MATIRSLTSAPAQPSDAKSSRAIPWAYLASAFASAFVLLIPHMCHDLHAEFLAISLPAAALPWFLIVAHTPTRIIDRLGPYLVVLFTSLVACLNLVQGLWTGCSPLLR